MLSNTILKGDQPRTIPAMFGLICFSASGFRGEDLYEKFKTYEERRMMTKVHMAFKDRRVYKTTRRKVMAKINTDFSPVS